MLALSLVAMIVGSALLFVDYQRYTEKKPAEPTAPVKHAAAGSQTQGT
jgi:hypothetical protein